MSGGKLVHESLIECGVDTVFGYSGGANLPILDQFNDSPMRFVMNRSEQCCGHAAEGYARATGRVGVVLTTSGPGLTNIITPLQDARGDSTPIVALSGQVPTAAVGTDAFQECLAVDLTRPCTKWSYQVKSVEEVRSVVHEAFRVASSGKQGPVHLDLPKDVMTAILRGSSLPLPMQPPPIPVDLHAVQRCAEMLAIAKKPILYVGQGANGAPEELLALAEAAQVPVTTTVHAMGAFSEHHPNSLHMLGMHGAAYANFAIQEADLIIAIGSRFDDRTTGVLNKYAPEAKKAHEEGRGGLVHFDIEPSQFGRVINPTIAIAGDCKLAMQALVPMLAEHPPLHPRAPWLERTQQLKAEYPFSYTAPPDGKLKTQSAIEAIYNGLRHREKDVIVATGVGNHQMMSCQFFRWTQPRQFITSGSLGTMGFGLPAAIGAQVACPDKTVLLIDGDGSFNMTLNDLGTIKEHQLPIKIAIMNDHRQQMVHVWQKLFFDNRLMATNNVNPDYVALAQSYGIESYRAAHVDDLPEVIDKFVNATGPVLVDFRCVPDICLPMVAPGKGLDEMFMPGSIDINAVGEAPKMEGLAPS
uniref:Acetolactate synthase n=1 Tax=Haptolina brevifila TaxID=156173 RepID=A0A7S2FZG0_9EUKA